jgi:hypothetical protein
MTEVDAPAVGEQSRAFRGVRIGDAAALPTFTVVFRQERVVGHIVVVLAAGAEDAGSLALTLARQQAAAVGRSAMAAVPRTPTPRPGPVATPSASEPPPLARRSSPAPSPAARPAPDPSAGGTVATSTPIPALPDPCVPRPGG